MPLRAVLVAACLVFAPALRAAVSPDLALNNALGMFVTNGLESGLRSLYGADNVPLATEMTEKIQPLVKNLGNLIDTEIVAAQPVSKRVTRFYLAIYFTRRPLWVRLERYQNDDRTFYLPLKFSLNSDDILPGYITEFRQ